MFGYDLSVLGYPSTVTLGVRGFRRDAPARRVDDHERASGGQRDTRTTTPLPARRSGIDIPLSDATRATLQGPVQTYSLLVLAFVLFPGVGAGDAIVRTNAMQASTIAEFFIEEHQILVEHMASTGMSFVSARSGYK